jgi:Fic family protein
MNDGMSDIEAILNRTTIPEMMEPMMPSLACPVRRELEDLSVDLTDKAARLAGAVRPAVQIAIGDLVRSMNCYYSNLIEGHDTHPADIERALKRDYSNEPKKRDLQNEAVAHIAVQNMIDTGEAPPAVSENFIQWTHKEFCSRLPDTLLHVTDPATKEMINVIPGHYRERDVEVGRHLPPEPSALPRMLERFANAYNLERLGRVDRVIAVAASHHRLAWIHPFLDGNGRVTRLFSHAMMKEIGIGSALWSISRGFARNVERYKETLMRADLPRQGDRDGRGALSEAGLAEFCRFFLETAIDQVEYMSDMLDTARLLDRLERHVAIAAVEKRLPKESYPLLREAFLVGSFARGKAGMLIGASPAKARPILKTLLMAGYLTSETPKSPVRLAFPTTALEDVFPRLYPAR